MVFPLEFKFKYQQKKSGKEKRLAVCRDRLFVVFHWLTVVLVVTGSFFTGSPQDDVQTWNMTLYCEDDKFNQPVAEPLDRRWAIATIVSLSFINVLLMSNRMFVFGLASDDLLEIMNYLLGLLFTWNVTYVLQSLIGYPYPSFFSNEQLHWLYCCKSCPDIKVTKKIHEIDLFARGSFPSYLTCAATYNTVFLFALACHLDEGKRFAAKLLALFAPGSMTLGYAWYLWHNNENHLQDLIGGALLGGFTAIFIMRDIFLKQSKKMDKLREDFVSVVMVRELGLAHMLSRETSEERDVTGEYTINLYAFDPEREPIPPHNSPVDDHPPPPYSTLCLAGGR